MPRHFTGKCPKCGKKIKGYDDWGEGIIFIMGFCKTCQFFYGEDEVDWEPRHKDKEGGKDWVK